MDIKREKSRKEFIMKAYRSGQTVSCLQINNEFQQIREMSVGKQLLNLVYHSSSSDYANKGISQGLPVWFSPISLWAAMHECTTNKTINQMRAHIHLFVRDSKQRKQDNEGRH